MSGIEILPALVYGGLAAGEGTAAAAAGLGAAGTAAGAGLGAGSFGSALGSLFGGGGLGGAGGSGLTAAEMKALEVSAAQSLAAGGEGFGASGGGFSALGSAQGTGGLLGATSAEASLYGEIAPGQLPPAQSENILTKGINALNKVGGAVNKLPKPVQGMLMSSLLAPPKPQAPPPASMPPRQATQAPPMQMAYQSAPPQTPAFAGAGGASGVGDGMGGGYGGSAKVMGLLGQGVTPEELEMLRRLRMQRRM